MNQPIERFDDLNVYREAFQLQQKVFELSKHWPKEEQYSLTDQIRRSSRSIGSNIAEAWSKRRYQAHFPSKLTDSDGELAETRHWFSTASECGYLSDEEMKDAYACCERVGAMLGRMIAGADRWCRSNE